MSNQNQSQDRCYIAILGLSEHFKNSGDIKKAIQCLSALFTFNPPLKVEARTHLQLGQLYATYTQNHDLSLSHTEKAWLLSENINAFDDVKFDAANLLAKLYQNQNQTIKAKTVLRKAIEYSQHNIYWYSKFLFQIAQIHVSDKEYSLASDLLSIGVDSSDENTSAYLKTQFILNRSMVLIIERKSNEVIVLLNQAALLIETIPNYHLKEYSRVFYLILQVSNSLQLGHVKSLKGILKQLQQIIQTIVSTPNWPSDEQIFGQNTTECFMWLPKEQLFVLVYVLTVSQSMISGFLEKTQKYTEKALTQIDKLKSQENKPILALFQVILLEHIAMCRLIMGNRLLAIKEISAAKDICMASENKTLLKSHAPQLHCLLGLYAMSVNMFDKAEMQFLACTETTQRELKLFANLNLAIVYLRTNNDENLKKMLAHISADYSQPFSNQAMLGSYYWVQGLNAFQNNGFQEAKRFLRESLKMGNAEDLNRLTSCSLVLLSHVFLSIGNSKESMNMVVPAMQLASKIPDVNVQLWGSAILKDLHKMLGNQTAEQEALNQQVLYSQALQNDQFQCTKVPEHLLLNWISNDPPAIMGSETEQFQQIAMPSTSHMNYGY